VWGRRMMIVKDDGKYVAKWRNQHFDCDKLAILYESSNYIVAKNSFIGTGENVVILEYKSGVQDIYEINILTADSYGYTSKLYYVDQSGMLLKDMTKKEAVVGLVDEANAFRSQMKALQDENDKLVHALGYYELMGKKT